MQHVYEYKTKKFTLINATKPDKKRVDFLIKTCGIAPEDATEILPPIQRSKILQRPGYIFMILLFPVYDRKAKEINAEEVDFFIAKNRLVVSHSNQIPFLRDFFAKRAASKKIIGSMADSLYEIASGLLNYCFPMIRHLNLDIEMIEKMIFKKYERRETVDTILRVKTNIFDFQRIMQTHEYVLQRLAELMPQYHNFPHLPEYAREITLSLGSFKDEINALHDANSTMVEYRVNEIIKVLTIFSVIVFPLTLLAALFGMNTQSTPILGAAYDFWQIVAIMGASASAMLLIFKWKRWI